VSKYLKDGGYFHVLYFMDSNVLCLVCDCSVQINLLIVKNMTKNITLNSAIYAVLCNILNKHAVDDMVQL